VERAGLRGRPGRGLVQEAPRRSGSVGCWGVRRRGGSASCGVAAPTPNRTTIFCSGRMRAWAARARSASWSASVRGGGVRARGQRCRRSTTLSSAAYSEAMVASALVPMTARIPRLRRVLGQSPGRSTYGRFQTVARAPCADDATPCAPQSRPRLGTYIIATLTTRV